MRPYSSLSFTDEGGTFRIDDYAFSFSDDNYDPRISVLDYSEMVYERVRTTSFINEAEPIELGTGVQNRVYEASGWYDLDVTAYDVPPDARAVFVWVSGNVVDEGWENYMILSGDGTDDDPELILRNAAHANKCEDVFGWVQVDENDEIHYKAFGGDIVYVSVRILAYKW